MQSRPWSDAVIQIDIRAPRSLLDLLIADGAVIPIACAHGGRSVLSVTAADLDPVEATVEVDPDRLDAAGMAIWNWYRSRGEASARLVIQLRGGTVRSTWLRPTTHSRDIDRVLTTLADRGLQSGLPANSAEAH
jgi:hypothetical protein